MTTFYITKYALTQNIYVVEAEEPNPDIPDMLVDRSGRHPQYFHGEGKDWHRTAELALVRAEQMRTAKITSLKKSIAKLETLRFGVGQ